MAGTVKIKKSKNLRYQLISILYLLFIALSALQIPNAWVRVSRDIRGYFNLIEPAEIKDEKLKEVYQAIEEIDQGFSKILGVDPTTDKYNEPEGYSKTDVYFYNQGYGKKLHSSLREYYKTLGAKEKQEFERLFEADIDNGFKSESSNVWVNWKFKHVPATVARALLSELKLRLILITGNIEMVNMETKQKVKLLSLAYNIENTILGDTVTLVVQNNENVTVTATYAGRTEDLLPSQGDTISFIPRTTGKHTLKLTKGDLEEELDINVKPGQFTERSKKAFGSFYLGETGLLEYRNLLSPQRVICSCDEEAKIDQAKNQISFVSNAPGWCSFNIKASNGSSLIVDSIYVQDVPDPFITFGGGTLGTLSRDRIKADKKITIQANHPEAEHLSYSIKDMEVKLLGANEGNVTINGNEISLTGSQVTNLKYLVIQKLTVSAEQKDISLAGPYVLRIIEQ